MGEKNISSEILRDFLNNAGDSSAMLLRMNMRAAHRQRIINQIAVGENLAFETKHRPLNLQCLAEFVFHKISFFKITKRRRESADIAINTLQNPGKI